MLDVTCSEQWKTTYPNAHIGILEVSGIKNHGLFAAFESKKKGVEKQLKQQYLGYTRQDFLELPVMTAYNRYYKRFDKTYHILLQLESIVLKGKSLPTVSALVDANFTAEVQSLVLTASHDAQRLQPPLVIDVSHQGDQLTRMSGELKLLPEGDMLMRDQSGVVCTILYGQDNISPITAQTTHALYVSYAPQGVGDANVLAHLQMVEKYIRLFSTNCMLEQQVILHA